MPLPGKEYGLILPKKKKDNTQTGTRTLNPLATSDDELERDDEEALNWVEASLKKAAGNSGQKSLQKRLLREAYEEDSTVFQYDEVYDDMKASQEEEQEKKKQLVQRKPKYIETILKHTEKRKLENERRLERKVQKEREAEGSEFADKESFVTSSYLKKLEELKQAEQDEQREKYLEEQIDVHKHKNFGVFYNHIFKQRVGETEIKLEPQDAESVESSTNAADSLNNNRKANRQKNYRTQGDISDEEYVKESGLNVSIKREVTSSSDEGGSESGRERKNRLTYANGDRRRKSRERSGSRDRNKRLVDKRRSKSSDRNRPGKYRRSRSKDRKESITEKRRCSRSRSKDRNNRRSRSKDRSGGRSTRRSRSRDKRENSDDYLRNNRSRSKDRKYSDKRRNSRSRDRRDGSVDRYRKERDGKRSGSLSRTDRKRDISVDKSMTREEKRRRENSRERDKKDTQSEYKNRERRGRSTDEREKDKERKSKANKENNSRKSDDKDENITEKSKKQSINTTLGKTDINKMNMTDRIQRFSEIFAKRTVDDKFEDAVQRYFQRKAEKEAA